MFHKIKNIGEGEIEQFISDIIQKAKESNLHYLEIGPSYCRKNKNWPCDRLLIVLTLVLQWNKKKMSALYSLLDHFKKHLKILFYVLSKECSENRFNILIYCKENDKNVEEEL